MQGIRANPEDMRVARSEAFAAGCYPEDMVREWSVSQADALLAALEEKEPTDEE